MKTMVIVPTYNERENLPRLLDELLAVQPEVDVLVVDDNSPDGTGTLADEAAARTPRVHVMHRAGKQGLGTAYVQGFRYALEHGYERIVEMDADFSHRPEDLPRLLRAAETADVAIGSRNVPGGRVIGWSPLRHIISKGGSLYARLVLGLPIHDVTGGFKCFRRRALQALDLAAVRSNGYGFQVEINNALHRAGMSMVEVPITFPDRERGASKMSKRIVLEAAALVLKLRVGLVQAPLAGAAAPARPVATSPAWRPAFPALTSLVPQGGSLSIPALPGSGLAITVSAGAATGALLGLLIETLQRVA